MVRVSVEPTATDVLAALIALTGEQYLDSDPHRFHAAVQLAQPICPPLGRFVFLEQGPHPISRALDEALGILKLARIIRMENTDYERYIVDPAATEYIMTVVVPRFDEEQIAQLRQGAAILREACGTKEVAAA